MRSASVYRPLVPLFCVFGVFLCVTGFET